MWKHPTKTKMYEALGAVADGRIEVSGNVGKCYSSSGSKYYDITFDSESNAIMSNDNTSYWTGELGYPAVAFLLKSGVLEYRASLAELLRGVAWKDLNQKFQNDFDSALKYILEDIDISNKEALEEYTQLLVEEVARLNLKKLGKRVVPPKGY